MAIMKGAMTTRRFRVEGDIPEDFREFFRKHLRDNAFREPAVPQGKEEVAGWVELPNLLDTSFHDFNTWLHNDYVVFALRVDKKTLPARLVRATLEKKVQAWCQERDVERCPRSVKDELREALESEWLRRVLPRVKVTEIAWNMTQRYAVVHSTSETVCDRVRRRFHRTFGLQLVPWSPLDFLEDEAQCDALMSTAPSSLREETA